MTTISIRAEFPEALNWIPPFCFATALFAVHEAPERSRQRLRLVFGREMPAVSDEPSAEVRKARVPQALQIVLELAGLSPRTAWKAKCQI